MNKEEIAKFAQGLRGPVIGRGHPDYEEARKLYNAMIDKQPLIITRCADLADVIAAVNFGRENKLPIGHSRRRPQRPRSRQRQRRFGHRSVDNERREGRPEEQDG
jgi:hypothetical protein